MRRRAFIAVLGGTAIARPLAGYAQQSQKVPHVGLLWPGPAGPFPVLDAFYQGLREQGYIDGQNVAVERVDAGWKPERFSQLAAELVQRKVDVILVVSTAPARAVKEATSTIPIVVATMVDPVDDGLVASLARPGGNLTGNTFLGPQVTGKRFGLLKEAIPGLSRVAALWHPAAYGERTMARILKETEEAARVLGVRLQLASVSGSDDFAGAFAAMTRQRAEALIVAPSPMLYSEYRRIVELVVSSRLPAIAVAREFAEDGGLMSYGADINDLNRRATIYVAKILKGAKPADLPVEQPTKFDFVINLKSARELGLVMPPVLLASADELIE